MAHENKGRPITTWRRPIGEKVGRSVWHMKIKPVHYYMEEAYRWEEMCGT